MEKSLKTDFAQIFSYCPKNLSCPKFGGGAAAPLPPPRPLRLWRKHRKDKEETYHKFRLIIASLANFVLSRRKNLSWGWGGGILVAIQQSYGPIPLGQLWNDAPVWRSYTWCYICHYDLGKNGGSQDLAEGNHHKAPFLRIYVKA